MSRSVAIKAEHDYQVEIGVNWREAIAPLLDMYGRIVVVVGKSLAERIHSFPGSLSEVHVVEIVEGEDGKSSDTLEFLWNTFGTCGLTRRDLVVAIGGGATTDIAGFAAATWLRGIDWIAIPTTLAGMVDAAVGGKTGMNSALGKNLIGSFHSPRKVIVDLDWLTSLSDRDFSAGMAEVVKCGFISDPRILELVSSKSVATIRMTKALVEELIFRAVTIKGRVVSEDFREGFLREILNYGHTMGHAIELHSNFSLRHGEAVSIGMVFIAELAHLQGVLDSSKVAQCRHILENLGLPTSYPQSALPALMPLLFRDKKTRGKLLRFIAVNDEGEILRFEGVTEDQISSAYGRVAS